eukprot:907549_1
MPSACATCNTPNAKSVCSRCKCMYYCNVVCQRKDWMKHKKVCKSAKSLIKKEMKERPSIRVCTQTDTTHMGFGVRVLFVNISDGYKEYEHYFDELHESTTVNDLLEASIQVLNHKILKVDRSQGEEYCICKTDEETRSQSFCDIGSTK